MKPVSILCLLGSFAIVAVLSYACYQEGMTNPPQIAYPNYNYPTSSSFLVKNGVIQDNYFLQFIQNTLQENPFLTTICSLEHYLASNIDPSGPFIAIMNQQYGSLTAFFNKYKSVLPSLSYDC